jgi:4-carboxymuconolactone decarboxylase
MADDEAHEAGEQMWREVMGFEPMPASDAFMQLTVDHVFGQIWTRPGLSRRERRLVSLTAAATAGHGGPLAIHLAAAVNSGDLSIDDLHEWVVQLAHYAGWPAGAAAYTAVREIESQQQT